MKPHEILNSDKVVYLKGVINYTEVHLTDGRKEVTCLTLKRYEETLSAFVRVNKSILVNPRFVICAKRDGDQYSLELKGGDQVSVSRRKQKTVCHFLKAHSPSF